MVEPCPLRHRRPRVSQALAVGWVILTLFSLAAAQKTSVDYDKSADFSKFKSYAWIKGTPAANLIVDAYIITSVDDFLQKKGLAKAEASHADLLLAYHAARDADLGAGVFSDPTYATTGGMALPGETVWSMTSIPGSSSRIIRKGSLAFELWDRPEHKLVWTGTAAGTLKDKKSQAMDQLYQAMAKLFDSYPPGKK